MITLLILGFLFITPIVLAITLLYIIYQYEDLEKEFKNAETRAVTHFIKVNRIEEILKYSNETKENYFITIDKINRVIFPNTTFKR